MAPKLQSDDFVEHALSRHGDAVFRLALNQLRSAADAQDVVQDTFIRLLTDELLAMTEKADESNWNEYLAAHAACAVQQLDGRVLTITATSPAGQTFTQRYRIIPVEGFEEAFRANLEATLDAVDAGADPAEASSEPLFILEQLG
ncbi:RNA polymerase sigma factor [Enorma phocaeensis]|uniref:RNA polymerase sigma factor n=1 Tax=Enorma phocaeensis TaxID=1871019 RepID=UPI0019578762|nr:sigma factor [Enorma phocaeensis]MBM6953756.1 hypothetical protein [Enorma phocaeensis]